MGLDLKQAGEQERGAGQAASAAIHDLDKQRLRILRCTAQAMASGSGRPAFQGGHKALAGRAAGWPTR